MKVTTTQREELFTDAEPVLRSFAGSVALVFMFLVSALYIYLDGRFVF